MKRCLFVLLIAAACSLTASAKIQLPQLFQSGMVLQRGKPIPVWGTADAGERVVIRWQKRQYATIADSAGHWRIDLPKMRAGGPYTMLVGDEVLANVYVGDVWLCSGQSNMDVHIERVHPQYPDVDFDYTNERIRLFRVKTDRDTHGPKSDVLATRWDAMSRESAWNFSAIGYFLARRMYEATGVPQGVICNSLGGTPVEAWIPADSLRSDFPMMVEQTRLYQDDELVSLRAQADQRANDRWFRLLNERDSLLFPSTPIDDSSWPLVSQYEPFASPATLHHTLATNFSGSLWLRQHIQIDAAHAGRPARLLLGTLYDQDYTYVNGREVGRTYYQYPPRRYQIPAGLLREGDNVISVRFVNKYGLPHFIREKPYMMIFDDTHDTLRLSEQWRAHVGAAMPQCPSGGTSIQNLPSVLYNAMLHPLAPYAVAGVVWYQGESNTSDNLASPLNNGPSVYAPLLRKLMASWRALWNEPQLPFTIVQLANFMQPTDQPQNSSWARLREAQRRVAAEDQRAELAVAIDLGETVDIHPLRKREVAERIGLCFDRLVYGKQVVLSPQLVSTAVEGGDIVLTFDQPLHEGVLYEWELAGSDGRYHNTEATASGRRITLKSPISSAISVRYAWKDNPQRANTYGLNGLPLAPFEAPL